MLSSKLVSTQVRFDLLCLQQQSWHSPVGPRTYFIPVEHPHPSLRTQTKFDEDSPTHARLERWAVGSEALSAALMLRRLRLFDVDTGFDLRRRAAGVIGQVEAIWSRCDDE